MEPLTASELAEFAGATVGEVERMVCLDVLVTRPGEQPFRVTDVQKVRLATACERAGLPMDGIASAIRAGRLSFAFLEASPYRRWAVRSGRTYRFVSEETGVPLDLLAAVLESMGFAPAAPDDPMREDELEVVPVVQLAVSTGVADLASLARLRRAYADALRAIATAKTEAYHAGVEARVMQSGADGADGPWNSPRSWVRSSHRCWIGRCWPCIAGTRNCCGPRI